MTCDKCDEFIENAVETKHEQVTQVNQDGSTKVDQWTKTWCYRCFVIYVIDPWLTQANKEVYVALANNSPKGVT